jgi:predicted metal-dependent peptidase
MLSAAMMQLIKNEPYYAYLLMSMSREISNRIPTIGVSVTDKINLIVNPNWWESLQLAGQVDILKHECLHVIYNHIGRAQQMNPEAYDPDADISERVKNMETHTTFNHAADVAINQYLPNLPKKFKMFDEEGNVLKDENGTPLVAIPTTLEVLRKKFPDKKIAERQTMEYYYGYFQEDKKNSQGNGKGSGKVEVTIDDHSTWNEGGNDGEVTEAIVKGAVNKALEKAREAGREPSNDILMAIEKLNHVSRDWRKELQRFVSRASEILIETSRKVRNRRYGIVYPGYKTLPKLNLAVAIDTSGSIGEEEFQQFMAEIDHISKNNTVVTIIQCDAAIQSVDEFDPRKIGDIKLRGGGGTKFAPVFELVNGKDYDGLIYFTDGYNFDDVQKPRYPVLWAVVPNGKVSYDWGEKIDIKIKKKT